MLPLSQISAMEENDKIYILGNEVPTKNCNISSKMKLFAI